MSNLAALYKKDLQMSYIPSVSQVEFSRHAKAPQPTCRALLRQRTTSAERDKPTQSASDERAVPMGEVGAVGTLKDAGSGELTVRVWGGPVVDRLTERSG